MNDSLTAVLPAAAAGGRLKATARKLVAAPVSPNSGRVYASALRQFAVWLDGRQSITRPQPATSSNSTTPGAPFARCGPPRLPIRPIGSCRSRRRCWLRFTAAARAAGLGPCITAHSGRVGLESELTAHGASTADVMVAGNWKSSLTVAHYASGATAERGVVAHYL